MLITSSGEIEKWKQRRTKQQGQGRCSSLSPSRGNLLFLNKTNTNTQAVSKVCRLLCTRKRLHYKPICMDKIDSVLCITVQNLGFFLDCKWQLLSCSCANRRHFHTIYNKQFTEPSLCAAWPCWSEGSSSFISWFSEVCRRNSLILPNELGSISRMEFRMQAIGHWQPGVLSMRNLYHWSCETSKHFSAAETGAVPFMFWFSGTIVKFRNSQNEHGLVQLHSDIAANLHVPWWSEASMSFRLAGSFSMCKEKQIWIYSFTMVCLETRILTHSLTLVSPTQCAGCVGEGVFAENREWRLSVSPSHVQRKETYFS